MPRKSGSGSSAFGAYGPRGPRCRECGRQFNERTAGALNRTQYPSDRIALVVPWRLRYRLTLRDLSEMFLARGLVSVARRCVSGRRSPLPIPSDELRQRRGRRRPSATCHWSQDFSRDITGRPRFVRICSISRRTVALRPVRPITPKMAGIGRGALRRTLHPDEDYAVSQPD